MEHRRSPPGLARASTTFRSCLSIEIRREFDRGGIFFNEEDLGLPFRASPHKANHFPNSSRIKLD
jgi:hypothetical protein